MKLLTLGGTALLTLFATANANADFFVDSAVEYEEATFEMGGQGPAGGVIFYLTDDKLHGMESAGYLKDSQGLYTLAEWGCNDIYKDVGFGVNLGEGKANSLELLAECSSERGGLIAAKHADNYVQNQYSDWYLPSQDELSKYSYLMWESGQKVVDSSADIEHYCTWSSTNYFRNAIGAGYAQGITQEFDEYYSMYISGRARSKECAIVPVRNF